MKAYGNIFKFYGIERPSFLGGVFRVVDIFSNSRNHLSLKDTDRQALLSDWQAVAEDLNEAMKYYDKRQKTSKKK